MVFQLSYELKTPEKDYTELYSFLEKEIGSSAIHVLRDTWWIKYEGSLNLDEICDLIKDKMGQYDVFFVSIIENKADINGWLASSNWKWLNQL